MRNEAIEKLLEDVGVGFIHSEEIPLTQIDMKASLTNQARSVEGGLIESNLDHFRVCMGNGDNTGPITVFRWPHKKDVIADGNHRIQTALNLGWKNYPFGAYIVTEFSENQLRLITYTLNGLNGDRPLEENLLEHAADFVRSMGMSIAEAAKWNRVMETRLKDFLHDRAIVDRMVRLGIRHPESINATSREKLNTIPIDSVFVRACNAVKEFAIPSAAVIEFVNKIRKQSSSEKAMMQVIAEYTAPLKEIRFNNPGNGKAQSTIAKVSIAVGRILAVKEEDVHVLSSETRRELVSRIDEGIAHLRKLKNA